jgi:hypothetical protein
MGHNRLSKALYALSIVLCAIAILVGVIQYPDIDKIPFYLCSVGVSSLMFGQYAVMSNLRKALRESERSWANLSKMM